MKKMNAMISSLIGTATIFCFSQAIGAADFKDAFEKEVFENKAGEKLPYRLLKPENYDAKKSYPLVLFLHGAGERGDDNVKTLVHVVKIFTEAQNRKKYPCFVLVPQCPRNKRWVEVHWGLEKHTQPKEASDPMELTMELLDEMQGKYNIDAKRLYVMGISMGGFGTWDIITRYPDKFAAAVPICGGGDEKTAQAIANLPVWAFHGDKDGAVKVDRTRNMIAAIKKAGGKPKYTEYPGVGHGSWGPASREKELLPWLFAQKKTEL